MGRTITGRPEFKKWMRRAGIGGFLFFLIKGLVWLIAGYYLLR